MLKPAAPPPPLPLPQLQIQTQQQQQTTTKSTHPRTNNSSTGSKRTQTLSATTISTALSTDNTLQNSGFRTPRRRKCSIDDAVSPRTTVSNRFFHLGLYGNTDMSTVKSTTSWTASLISGGQDNTITDDVTPRSIPTTQMKEQDEMSVVIEETPEPSISGTTDDDDEMSSDEEVDYERKDLAREMYRFNSSASATESYSTIPTASSERRTSATKRARFEPTEPSPSDFSPAKRRRRTSLSPPPNISIPASPDSSPPPPLSPSPVTKKQQLHSPRPASPTPIFTTGHPVTDTTILDGSVEEDEMDSDIADYWWQPSEITGHTPDDPDEDNYGVNGIGYQKSKAEAWNISQKKKRQLAEWRSREAREARALRAGGRKSMAGLGGGGVASGRVTKSGSRSGSPVAGDSGRRSPFSPRKEREERIARAVRFEIG